MSRARETTGGPPRTGRPGAVPPDATGTRAPRSRAEPAPPASGARTAPGATGAGPASALRTAGVEELVVHLTALSDAELASLLAARPDLISPPSPSLTSLAARAGARPSVERALADLDAPALDAARAVLATGSQDPAALAAALGGDEGGVDEEAVAAGLEQLTRLCLLTAAGPVTGLVEALRPAPAAASATGAAGAALPAPSRAPDPAELDVQDAAAVADQCARAAEELVRLTSALLAEWGREGAPILRSGGVGARALARTAQALDLAPAATATLIELTASAGLLGLDAEGEAWVPARPAVDWARAELPERWARLAAAWAGSARTPWLVGTRSDDGSLRPVLGDDVEAPWARRLRRRILMLLETLPEGASATPTWVRAALTHARPRRPVPAGAVTAVLAEAELLGATGGGSLTRPGRVLALSLTRASDEPPARAQADAALLEALEAALARDLPTPVETLLVQSDLTAVVPGRPAPVLAELLERAGAVESRGGALTVRFTAESVRGALDAGLSADELVEALERFTPGPLPSALTVLIDDVARRHGAVRVRGVSSLLRAPDPAVAAGLIADARLRDLELAEAAPGVLASTAPPGRVLRELREAGLAPVLEDAGGRLLLAPGAADGVRRGAPPESHRPGTGGPVRRRRPTAGNLAAHVGRMRAGERERAGAPAATDPVHVLALLRQARAARTRLRLRLAAGDGDVQERTVRVLAVESGRARLADLERETELTAALHRIVSVEPDPAAPSAR
ncbi:helicase-associated domain-containing protein [Actinomyces dentalis]|uniref:helicase-associated domain-containing protein n=1 Tax=Actinomyces dentalis TaxID=272548 RepID=UPI0006861381|nr:helicase-associated domain-containing protein [Actinomyces dentalis]